MRSVSTSQDETSAGSEGVLSISQQRLWVLEQLHRRHAVHNISSAVRLNGPLHARTLECAWRDVTQRHAILRTEFHDSGSGPQSLVLESSLPLLRIVDLESVPQNQRESTLSRLALEEICQPFDVSRGPLLRASLWRLSPDDWVFLIVGHRLVCDELSLVLLTKELSSKYGNGGKAAGPTAPQYNDSAAGQGPIPREQISYWNDRLAGAPFSLDLPVDRPRPPEQTFRGAILPISIDGPLVEKLHRLSEHHEATLFSTLLAALAVLLCRYSRQDDIVVGTMVSGRDSPGLENVVGPLENMLPLRMDLSGPLSFSTLLNKVEATVHDALLHQIPFEGLLQQIPLERDLSRNPLFQATLRLRKPQIDLDCAWVNGIVATRYDIETGVERFDLSLDFTEIQGSLAGKISYNADLWEPASVARFAEHFIHLLERLVDQPSAGIFDLSPLSEAERRKLLVEFNATATDLRRDLCIHQFFERQVQGTPQAVAVVWGQQRLTYGELNARANRVAHYLRKQGVGPEVLVGICAERSLEMVVGILGILKAGGAYVPLDPAYPEDRLGAILEDAKAPFILVQERTAGILPKHRARVIRLDADWPTIAAEPATDPALNVSANNLGYVLFTSGSTGRPKGVALEHRSAAIFIQWAQRIFSTQEIAGTLFSTSICFDLSVFELFVPLSMGGQVIVAQNALELPKLPARHEVTLINTVPSAIAELLRMNAIPKSVVVVNLAGEALPSTLARQIYAKSAVKKVYNLYGPTEDTTYSTFSLVPRQGEVTIGKPLPNTQVYILNQNQELVPVGVPGELYLAGDGLARGYFGRDDLTAERFLPNPFADRSDARMYRTGDLARFLSDGNIQYLGRIDNQVKLRGFRIELGEIESVLTQNPSIQSAVALVREDIPGDKRLVAYVVPSGRRLSPAALKAMARERLPEYMIPSAFVEMDAIPLSPNGKINRRLLPPPDWSADAANDVTPPRNEVEAKLLTVWQRVLGTTKVGVKDDFFALGGHSMMAARVLFEAEKATGKELPLSAFFRGATIESLAKLITEDADAPTPVLMEIQHGEGHCSPFFAIVPPGEESLGYAMLARHMGRKQTVYKVQGSAPVLLGKRPYSNEEMQTLTREYVAAIREAQPHGPYCLGGLCDGTHIAEQVVRELEAQGEEVGLFAIFDTWVLQHTQRRWLWTIYYFSQRLREAKLLNLAERLSLYRRATANKVQNLLGKKPVKTSWEEAYWPEAFTPVRFRAPVILFKRAKQPFYYINDPLMGWGQRTTGSVTTHQFEFHHLEILREPHVRIFGEELAAAIEEISRRPDETAFPAEAQPSPQPHSMVQHARHSS